MTIAVLLAAAALSASPVPLDFGEVGLGTSRRLVVTLRNETETMLKLGDAEAPSPFLPDLFVSESLPPASTTQLGITFRPQVAGPSSAIVTVPIEGLEPFVVELKGSGLKAAPIADDQGGCASAGPASLLSALSLAFVRRRRRA